MGSQDAPAQRLEGILKHLYINDGHSKQGAHGCHTQSDGSVSTVRTFLPTLSLFDQAVYDGE